MKKVLRLKESELIGLINNVIKTERVSESNLLGFLGGKNKQKELEDKIVPIFIKVYNTKK